MTKISKCIALFQLKILHNSIAQLSPSYYLKSVTQNSTTEHWCPGYTKTRNIIHLLGVITIYQPLTALHPKCQSPNGDRNSLLNLSNPLYNFKLMPDFKLTNLTKTKFNFIISILQSITDIPIVSLWNKLEEIDEYNKSLPLTGNSNRCHISCKAPHIFMHLMWTMQKNVCGVCLLHGARREHQRAQQQ